jgi:hypothetical protein
METHLHTADDVSRPVATSHDDEPCTVSVSEASELFATAGLPRTERAIQRFCKKGELKCSFVETPFGSKYLIARSSIDRLIVQKQQAQKFASDTTARDLSRPDATERDRSRRQPDAIPADDNPIGKDTKEELPPTRHDGGGDDKARQRGTAESDDKDQIIEKLRGENFDLKVDNAGKQNFIRQLVANGEKLMGEVKQISYELGVAHTRVAQLEAPKITYDMPRSNEVMAEEVTTVPTPVAVEPRRGFFRRKFGNK